MPVSGSTRATHYPAARVFSRLTLACLTRDTNCGASFSIRFSRETFAGDGAEIGGRREIAAFEELRRGPEFIQAVKEITCGLRNGS